MPWHSMYISRPPPILTRPEKSLAWPELLALTLWASAGAAAASTTAATPSTSATRLLILAPFCFPTVPASYLLAAPSSRAPSLTCPDSLVACIVWGQHKPCDQPKIRPLPGHDSQGVRRKRNFLELR